MTALPCPNCGADLTFLEQYQRHFCYACQQYAPEGYGARGPKICPTCGGILSYVPMYDRFFCYRCQLYAPSEAFAGPATASSQPEPASAAEPEPTAVAMEAEEGPSPAAPEETPAEEELIVADRPPLTRSLIETAKKSVLLDLCKACDLDPTGTKEQLKERLLSFLEEQEAAQRAAEPEAEEPVREEVEPESAAEPFEAGPAREEAVEAPAEGTAQAVLLEEPPKRAMPERASAIAPQLGPRPEVVPAAMPVEGIREAPAVLTAVAPAVPVYVEHPCPRCERELDYIAQYDRWYCHFCRSYAPKRTFKHACPTCGATLRWIERYSRWWCDAEQRYAPADLPSPEGAPAAESVATAVAASIAQEVARPAIVVHRHRSPGGGIGIAAFGIVLWLFYQLLVEVPRVTSIAVGVSLTPETAFLLQFFGFLFLGVGILVGLSALRNRR